MAGRWPIGQAADHGGGAGGPAVPQVRGIAPGCAPKGRLPIEDGLLTLGTEFRIILSTSPFPSARSKKLPVRRVFTNG